MTSIKGCGRRFSNIVCKADVDMSKRAGELSEEEVERIVTIMNNPRQYKIPDWFLNRQKDIKDGKFSQVLANGLDNKMREDLERLKKIRAHRGLRHYWGLRVRGQHTNDRTTWPHCWCLQEEGRLIFRSHSTTTTDCFWEQVVAWCRFHHPYRARRLFSHCCRFSS